VKSVFEDVKIGIRTGQKQKIK